MGEASIGADEGGDLLITSEIEAMSVEAPDIGVPHTPDPDLVDEELLTSPLISLLVV